MRPISVAPSVALPALQGVGEVGELFIAPVHASGSGSPDIFHARRAQAEGTEASGFSTPRYPPE